MKKRTNLFLASVTSASILVLSACQPSGVNAPQLNKPTTNQIISSKPEVKAINTSVSDRPVFGKVEVDGEKKQIKLTIQYPEPEDFKTQALDCNPFASFEVKVEGIGLTNAIFADGADANNRIAATPGNCQFTATLSNVPIGNNRIVIVKAFNSSGTPIAGTELMAPVNITNGTATNAEISYKTYPTGKILATIMGEAGGGITPHPHIASKLDNGALQTLVNGIMAVAGTFPNYTYPGAHPYLINTVAIANDLIANGGDPTSLTVANPAYVLAGQSVNVDVSGATVTNIISVIVRDPVSAASTSNAFTGPTDTIEITGVPPGNWPVTVVDTTASVTQHVTATAGGANVAVNLGATNWTQTAGPVTAYVNTLFHAGDAGISGAGANEVYIGTKAGIYKTANITNLATNPWTPIHVSGGLTDLNVTAIALNPANNNEIVVGTNSGGIFRTNDGGVSAWGSESITGNPKVNDLLWNGGNIFASTDDAFWRSATGGALSWGPAMDTGGATIPSPGSRTGSRFSREPGNTFWSVIPAAGAFRTTFGQDPAPPTGNWNNINAGTTALTGHITLAQVFSVHAVNAGEVYVGSNNGKVINYDGSTWSDVSGGLPSEEISAITNNGTDYFAGTFGEGVYHHSGTPSGSWTQLGTALENTMIKDLDVVTGPQIFASTKGGVFSHSGTSNTTWVSHNTQAFKMGRIHDLHLALNDTNHSTLYAAVDSDGIHKTTDSGSNWFKLDQGGGLPVFVNKVAADPNSNFVYAGTPGIGVWRSNTGGNANWVQLNSGTFTNTLNATELHIENESGTSFVYAAAGAVTPGLLKAQVGNETNNVGILSTQQAFSVAVDPNNPAIVYAGSNNGNVYKSINATSALGSITFDGGTDIDGGDAGNIIKIVVHPLDSNVLYAISDENFSGSTSTIYKSTDAGASWNAAEGNLEGVSGAGGGDELASFAVDPNNVNTIYAGLVAGANSRFMKSSDGGTSWQSISTGLFTYPTVLTPKPAPATEMFMGTFGSSVWKRSL